MVLNITAVKNRSIERVAFAERADLTLHVIKVLVPRPDFIPIDPLKTSPKVGEAFETIKSAIEYALRIRDGREIEILISPGSYAEKLNYVDKDLSRIKLKGTLDDYDLTTFFDPYNDTNFPPEADLRTKFQTKITLPFEFNRCVLPVFEGILFDLGTAPATEITNRFVDCRNPSNPTDLFILDDRSRTSSQYSLILLRKNELKFNKLLVFGRFTCGIFNFSRADVADKSFYRTYQDFALSTDYSLNRVSFIFKNFSTLSFSGRSISKTAYFKNVSIKGEFNSNLLCEFGSRVVINNNDFDYLDDGATLNKGEVRGIYAEDGCEVVFEDNTVLSIEGCTQPLELQSSHIYINDHRIRTKFAEIYLLAENRSTVTFSRNFALADSGLKYMIARENSAIIFNDAATKIFSGALTENRQLTMLARSSSYISLPKEFELPDANGFKRMLTTLPEVNTGYTPDLSRIFTRN